MFGDAELILLIRVIYLIIRGKMATLTPIPQSTMKENQGICVIPYNFTRAEAVTAKIGAKGAQKMGKA